jgi:hypothetical protein
MPRKQYAGGAVATKLNGSINNSTTTVVVLDGSTYPSGATPFVIAVDRGTASEEKMLCTRVAASNTLTATRGFDGTTAVSHNDAAVVEHVLDALTIDEVNLLANTMTANGDLLTRAGGAPVALPVGSTGQVLSVVSGAPAWAPAPSQTNVLINGAFAVNQRGTAAVTTDQAFVSDRWQLILGAASTPSAQAVAFGTGDRISGVGEQFARFLSVSGTLSDAVNGYILVRNVIEDVRTLAGQTVTVSFWAKATTAGTLGVRLQQRFANAGVGDVDVNASVNVTTSWQRLSVTMTLPSLGTKTIGSSSYLNLVFDKLVGTAYSGLVGTITGTLSLTGVQLEQGSVATPYIARPFAAELAMCERYFQRYGGGSLYEPVCSGFTYSATDGFVTLPLRTLMRVLPTLTIGSGTGQVLYASGGVLGGAAIFTVTLQVNGSGPDLVQLTFTSAGMAVGPVVLRANNNLNTTFDFSAEF